VVWGCAVCVCVCVGGGGRLKGGDGCNGSGLLHVCWKGVQVYMI
jgi:hypothetical protein